MLENVRGHGALMALSLFYIGPELALVGSVRRAGERISMLHVQTEV